VEEESVPWAAAGSNATLYLTAIDPVHLAIGNVLCSTTDVIPLATVFTARIIVFDIQVPITAGTSVWPLWTYYLDWFFSFGLQVELFHHSRDVSATMSKLVSIIDRASGQVLKANPRLVVKSSCVKHPLNLSNRVLTKGTSAEVQIALRATSISGPSSNIRGIPLETFAANKDMGRILIRRGGETIGAGAFIL
jgi:elongation factor 1 alpha-like protein